MTVQGSRRFRAKAFLRSGSGASAVEFALVAPFLILLYLGGSELSMAVAINRKVAHAAATVADLVTQKTNLSADDLRGIMQASKLMIAPYASTNLKLRISSIKIDVAGKATVEWSCPSTGLAKLTTGSAYTLPVSFSLARSRSIVVSETVFDYKPMSVAAFTGPIQMGSTEYGDPRIGSSVTSDGCTSITL